MNRRQYAVAAIIWALTVWAIVFLLTYAGQAMQVPPQWDQTTPDPWQPGVEVLQIPPSYP